jgi:hypothetical protein
MEQSPVPGLLHGAVGPEFLERFSALTMMLRSSHLFLATRLTARRMQFRIALGSEGETHATTIPAPVMDLRALAYPAWTFPTDTSSGRRPGATSMR